MSSATKHSGGRTEPKSLSGRPMHTLSDRSLRRYECAWCNQRLDRAKKGHCGAIWDRHECPWPEVLAPAVGRPN